MCFRILLPLIALAPLPAFAQSFALKDTPGQHLDVLRNGKVLARYMTAHDTSSKARHDETYKPYLHVFDPASAAPITKGPGGTFPHHRGIYIGWNKINVGGKSYDRWHMKGGDQVHEKFIAQTAEKDRASFTSLVKWEGATPAETLLEEERTFTFLPAPAPAYALIDVVSKLKAVAGETVLGGDREHAGVQFRPVEEVDRTKTTYLFPVEKADVKKDRDYPWFAGSFVAGGQRYSVVYLNHPANPKDAEVSAYRDYGRFGAYFKATIPAGGTQEIRSRFLVVAGEMPSSEVIQKAWNEYTGKSDPVPKTTVKAADVSKPAAPKKPATSAPAGRT